MGIYLARFNNQDNPKDRRWILWDSLSRKRLTGARRESKFSLIERWNKQHGKLGPGSVVRYSGVMRVSELAMTMASVREDDEEAAKEAEAKQ